MLPRTFGANLLKNQALKKARLYIFCGTGGISGQNGSDDGSLSGTACCKTALTLFLLAFPFLAKILGSEKKISSSFFVGQAVFRVRMGLLMGHFQLPLVAKLL